MTQISEPLTWKQIAARYPRRWVCLVDVTRRPGSTAIRAARVAGHGDSVGALSARIDEVEAAFGPVDVVPTDPRDWLTLPRLWICDEACHADHARSSPVVVERIARRHS